MFLRNTLVAHKTLKKPYFTGSTVLQAIISSYELLYGHISLGINMVPGNFLYYKARSRISHKKCAGSCLLARCVCIFFLEKRGLFYNVWFSRATSQSPWLHEILATAAITGKTRRACFIPFDMLFITQNLPDYPQPHHMLQHEPVPFPDNIC